MFIHVGTPPSLAELPNSAESIQAVRAKTKILIIDDEPFAAKENLMSHGYQVTHVSDLQSIQFASDFPIIICDIKGVGKQFMSAHEGAHLFKEIRKAFPEKYIIAFTGFLFDATFNEYFNTADTSLKKDTSIEVWVKVLDKAIEIMNSPKSRWLRMRKHLLDNIGLDLWFVLCLEADFIRSIRSNKKDIFIETVSKLGIPDTVKILLKGFSGSLFTDLAANIIISAVGR